MALTQVDQGLLSTNAQYTGFKNRLINSAMVIDQRNAGAATANTINGYTLDRWRVFQSVAGKFTVQQNAGSVTPPAGFNNYLGVTSVSAYSVGSGDYYLVDQPIEGFNVADLNWGAATAQTVTVSFWVRSSLTGTFGASISNESFNRTYPFTYTISSANTWEQKSVTIVGDTAGSWNKTNSIGMQLRFVLGCGSSRLSSSINQWNNAGFDGPTGSTSVVGTNGATFYITGVQLEKGSTATSFDYRPYGTELQLCQRYYEKTYDITTAAGSNTDTGRMNYSASSDGNGNFITDINFKVSKRAAPTLTAYVGVGTSGLWTYEKSGGSGTNAVTFDQIGQSHARGYFSIGTNWVVCYCYGHWTASAEL